MNAFIEATKWPMGFEPDDTTSLLQCTIVNERTSVGTSVGQHVHQTGQFVVALSGLVGLALGRNRIAFPPSSAAWVPPGCRHEGFLGEGAVSLYCHINPEWAAMLPTEPYRLLLSPMVIEMLKHFSTLPRRFPMHSHEARLAGVLLRNSLPRRNSPSVLCCFPTILHLSALRNLLFNPPSLTGLSPPGLRKPL